MNCECEFIIEMKVTRAVGAIKKSINPMGRFDNLLNVCYCQ